MAFIDIFEERLKASGWLSFSSLCFDNGHIIVLYGTRGYCAYSKEREVFIHISCMDTADTANIEHRFNIINDRSVNMQRTLSFIDSNQFQHFELAMYSHLGTVCDDQDTYPYPNIPTMEELDKLEKDPKTGLYPGTDTSVMLSGREVSTLSMYDAFSGDRHIPYSGAVVDEWKMWYNNHKKFVAMLKKAYNITDAV